jgi:AraC-like DNA-binding protein
VYFNWGQNKTAIYLGLGLIMIAIYAIAHYFIIYGENSFWIALFLNNFTPTHLLIGPLIFFYIRGTLTNNSLLKKTDWIHLIPALIHLLGVIPWYFKPWNEKIDIAIQIMNNKNLLTHFNYNFIFSSIASFFICPFLLLAYLLCSFYLVLSHQNKSIKDFNQIPQHQFKISHRWLFLMLTTLLIVNLSFIAITIDSITTNPVESLARFSLIHQITAFMLAIMTISLLFFPQILYGIPLNTFTEKTGKTTVRKVQLDLKKTSDFTSSTKLDPFIQLSEKIIEYMDKEKPYTNIDFSIEDLSKSLNAPLKHITYCLNEILGIKFTTLRMQYRVNYSIELLEDEKNEQFTIEAIANRCGFSSRSTFYAAFKECNKITPKEYIFKNQK